MLFLKSGEMASNLQRLTNGSFYIERYLRNLGFDVGGRGKKLNDILVEYLKSKKLKYEKWNPRYKGLFTANLSNSSTVLDNWDDFKKYIKTIRKS